MARDTPFVEVVPVGHYRWKGYVHRARCRVRRLPRYVRSHLSLRRVRRGDLFTLEVADSILVELAGPEVAWRHGVSFAIERMLHQPRSRFTVDIEEVKRWVHDREVDLCSA